MSRTLIDLIRDGDLEAVRRCLVAAPRWDEWAEDDLAEVRDLLFVMRWESPREDDLRAFGAEVLRHAGPGFAELLFGGGKVSFHLGLAPSGPWGDIDPVVWAADHGTPLLLTELLINPVPAATLRHALEAARAWFDTDPEAELRRRLGVDAGTVERDVVVGGEYLPGAPRIRLTAPDGRWSEVLIAHRAIATRLEENLGLPVSRAELLARARWSADPDRWDWSEASARMSRQFSPAENVAWAVSRLADPDVLVRRFTAEMLHTLAFDEDGPPISAMLAALPARLAVEPDPWTMENLVAAYGNAGPAGEVLHELLPYARDPRPAVRARVAAHLLNHVADPPPDVLDVVLGLAHDPDPEVRLAATATLAREPVDTPALRELLATHLAGDDHRLRIEAATGLAFRGDANALGALRRLSDEDGAGSHAWWSYDNAERLFAGRG